MMNYKHFRLIVITLTVLQVSIVYAQDKNVSDSVIYQKAYNYIMADKILPQDKANVSIELIGSCYLDFYDEIRKTQDVTYEELSNLDINNGNTHLTQPLFKKWFKTYETPSTIYFSNITNNDLFAIVQVQNFTVMSAGESYHFYFIFDSAGKIKAVYKKKMELL